MVSHLSRVQLFATPWTVASQAPLSMEFSKQVLLLLLLLLSRSVMSDFDPMDSSPPGSSGHGIL